MNKKKLILFTIDKITRDANIHELKEFFGEFLDVEAYTISDNIEPKSLEANLILTVSPIPAYKVQCFMKEETEVLNGNRTIRYDSYNKIKILPEGTKALVISTNKFTTLDLTYFLMKLEITNVELIPVYKGVREIPKGDIAIVPLAIDPDIDIGNIRILDLNTRRITPETYEAIMFTLNIKSNLLDNKLFELSKELVNTNLFDGTMSKLSDLGNVLNNTLHAIDDGVIVISGENKIIYSNQSIFNILNYEKEHKIPEYLNESILPQEIYEKIINNSELDDYLCYSKKLNKYLIVSKKSIPIRNDYSRAIIVLRDISNIQNLENKIRGVLHKKGHVAKFRFEDIIGQSEAMNQVISQAKIIAAIDKPTFITGESGTGKELFAQSIHNSSKRSEEPFVAVNCAAFTPELLESELFGYVEGSFTGARKGGKQGLFELAHGGTLFLDEVGDTPLNMQIKLLRVLQEGEVRRIGGEEIIPVNVRVISATNKNLEELVERGDFRLDLYYRLKVFNVNIPPLRDRKKDIPLLIKDRLHKLAEADGISNIKSVNGELMEILVNHKWNGNIRELINCVEYMHALGAEVLEPDDLPPDFKKVTPIRSNEMVTGHDIVMMEKEIVPVNEMAHDVLASFTINERKTILEILKIISHRDIGRRKILNILKEKEIEITEYKLRKILTFLKEQSIISYDKNNKGVQVSSKGELLLGSV